MTATQQREIGLAARHEVGVRQKPALGRQRGGTERRHDLGIAVLAQRGGNPRGSPDCAQRIAKGAALRQTNGVLQHAPGGEIRKQAGRRGGRVDFVLAGNDAIAPAGQACPDVDGARMFDLPGAGKGIEHGGKRLTRLHQHAAGRPDRTVRQVTEPGQLRQKQTDQQGRCGRGTPPECP
jgi:hypothetical protein